MATGGLLGGGTTILVCGGMEEGSYKWSDKCTILGLDSIPTSGITMLKRRGGAQSLVLDQDTLWVTGGGSRFLGWHFLYNIVLIILFLQVGTTLATRH